MAVILQTQAAYLQLGLSCPQSRGARSHVSSSSSTLPLRRRLGLLPNPSLAGQRCRQNLRPNPRVGASASLSSPKGFGPKKEVKEKKGATESVGEGEGKPLKEKEESSYSYEASRQKAVVPEVVTNRMLKRMGIFVAVPAFSGILFFPLFYYLKVIQKVDVPEWLPLISSGLFFGSAGLGISYAILSTSWDPSREGTMLGVTEARANWPVFWQTFRGRK